MSGNSDDGFSDMPDWLQDELEFYGAQDKSRPELYFSTREPSNSVDRSETGRSSERPDSGISIKTPRRDWPLKEVTKNQIHPGICRYVVRESDMKLAELYAIKESEYKLKGENWILTDPRIITHLLDFLDLPPDFRINTRAATESPLYSIRNNKISIDDRYQFQDSDLRKTYGLSQVRNYGNLLLQTKTNLLKVIDLVKVLRAVPEIHGFWKIFLDFLDEYLQFHSAEVDVLRAQNFKRPDLLLCSCDDLKDGVELVMWLVNPHLGKYSWTWKNMDTVWETMYRLWADPPEAWTKTQVKIIARLQYLMLPVLISSLEMLYSECVVPVYLKNQWFFEDNNIDPSFPKCHFTKEQTSSSLMWSDETLQEILSGVKARYRLNASGSVIIADLPTFSQVFENYLQKELATSKPMGKLRDPENEDIPEPSYTSTYDICRAMRKSIWALTEMTNAKLLDLIRRQGLIGLWDDLREITIGRVSESFSRYLYSYNVYLQLDSAQAFMTAIRDFTSKENHNRFMWSTTQKEFTCLIEAPLSYIYNDSLMVWLNEVMTFLHELSRAKEILVSIQNGENWMYSRRVQNRIADMEAQEQERLVQEFRNATINQVQNQPPALDDSSDNVSTISGSNSVSTEGQPMLSVLLVRRCQRLIYQLINILANIMELFHNRVQYFFVFIFF
ncbi:hypothetical protein WR25_24065 [Diploscapter pachys]|uniref:Uncharacterized protein n=1 Tax=Diploscapter pachys TaxID=2018661 RepID=A0A2A2K822_9BILA|nr:hypothetical protein WR25_24065 [Diploscapter pachys]